MTEEIKEMLHCIEMNCKHNKCFGGIKLDEKDCKLLLDYITNLQQENEKLKYNARGQVNDYFKDKYADEVLKNAELKKENERLKEKINTLKSNFEVEIDDCENYKKWYRDYKSRCKKAIEYIENNKKETSSHFNGKEYVYRNFTLYCEPNDLLNILNGSDEK